MMTLDEAQQRLQDARAYLHIDDRAQELSDLDKQIALPDFWNNTEHAQQVSKQASALRDIIDRYQAACALFDDIQTAQELAEEDPEFAQELESDLAQLEKTLDDFEVDSWFSGPYDSADAIVSIHPGSGGLEAQDWTEMLYRMYTRYADLKGWKVRILDLTPGDGIGLNRASFQVEGHNAYGMLRSETGVHRLVRISPTDEKKRRHTTFAAVEVVPVLPDDDITVEIDPNDVRVDVYRSSGPGGQSVNTTDSAVRLTHIPTGTVVACQDEKSQLKNKEKAMKVLRARLYEVAEAERLAGIAEDRKSQVGTGDRSERIRTYNYPQGRVTDHRIGLTLYKLEAFLNGDIDEVVNALITADQAEKMKQMGNTDM